MLYFLKAMVRELMLVPLCVALLFSLSSCEIPSPEPPPSPVPPPPPNGTIDFAREPLYTEQWYLKNTGQQEGIKGIDINIEPVWQKGYGKTPVYVGILDQTIDRTHPDLQANIPSDNVITDGFVPYSYDKSHGTRVAGLLAARDNGVGIIGVAPRAILYSYGIFGTSEKSHTVISERTMKALQRDEYKTIAVYNGSYGDPFEPRYNNMNTKLEQAIQCVIDHGFYEKGSNLVFAAGNFGWSASPSNDSYLNHYAVIAVNGIMNTGSINSSTGAATEGENIWIAAPTGKLITTDTRQEYSHKTTGYVTDFGGTSAAAPLVSGAIALLRSEYPDLTWRDVKLIIAESARKYDSEGQISYRESGRMYSDTTKQQTYHHGMGFGLLDVAAAFSLASNWPLLPSMKEFTGHSTKPLAITKNEKYTSELPIRNSNIQFIESLTIEIGVEIIKNDALTNWLLQLIAPDGKKVAPIFTTAGGRGKITAILKEVTSLTFLVNSFLGSSADGVWTLEIQQNDNVVIKRITRWSITVRGH